jgi:small nuclear ribonucleoprotein E
VYFFSCQRTRIAVWLYEQSSLRIEGRIIGFDEFMNLVLDDAEEVPVAKGAAPAGPRRALGRILLKGGSPLRAGQRACVPRAARVAAVRACVRRARVPPPRSSLPPRTEFFFAGDNVTLIRAVVAAPSSAPAPAPAEAAAVAMEA